MIPSLLKFFKRAFTAIKLSLLSFLYTSLYLIEGATKKKITQNFFLIKLILSDYTSRLLINLKKPPLPWFKKGPLLLNETAKLLGIYTTNMEILLNLEVTRKKAINYPLNSLEKIKETTRSLHSLLPENEKHSYSLLLIIDSNSIFQFNTLLNSAINTSAPFFDIVIGFLEKPTAEIETFYLSAKKSLGDRLQRVEETLNLSTLCNKMVTLSKGQQLVFVKEGFIRPDLLFRFEQVLLKLSDRVKIILYPEEREINNFSKQTLKNLFFEEEKIFFPYLFYTDLPSCFTLSKTAFETLQGFQSSFHQAAIYDLFLRADLLGLKLKKLPLPLFATFPTKQASSIDDFILALKNYSLKKNLSWTITEGLLPGTIGAFPEIRTKPKIHVIIPFKDQKKMTLQVVKNLKEQTGVDLKITMVDNRSDDLSIREALLKEGTEVVVIDEPFNFSRLNNLAVERSQGGDNYPLVLFLNNDIELFDGALLELCRWVNQPNIGMVGGRLLFPNGLLQCGSTKIKRPSISSDLNWIIPERLKSEADLTLQKTLHVTEAVSGAMLLMKKSVFLELGGFDEILYPNTYSDTALCAKALKRGYFPFYTPYAVATHYESLSRVTDNIEDFENSRWVYETFV